MVLGETDVKHAKAIDLYIREQWADGRFNSPRTERDYRATLARHANIAQQAGHPTVQAADRQDILDTLEHWTHPTSKRTRRAQLVSYYDWAQRAGRRDSNPARQTRAPKRTRTQPMILGRQEVLAILGVARQWGGQGWWAIEILACTGLRNAELRGLKARDLGRRGWVHVPPEIAKGHRERWIPATESVHSVAGEVGRTRRPGEYVLASQQTMEVGITDPAMRQDPERPMSPQALMRLLQRASREADLGIGVTPHMLRHHFGHQVATLGSIWSAQALLGHADIGTTVDFYTGRATETETAKTRDAMSAEMGWAKGSKAPTGIEPVTATTDQPDKSIA